MEARDECLELLLDAFLNPPFCDKAMGISILVSYRLPRSNLLNIFPLVLICHINVFTTRFQFDANSLSESLVLCGKGQFQGIGDVIVPADDMSAKKWEFHQ